MKRWAMWVCAVGLCGSAAADEILIRGATVHTLQGAALQRSDVRIRDGVIAEIGSGLSAGAATVIEANGRPLTPGLFGGITALGIEEVELEPSTVDKSLMPGSAEIALPIEARPEFDVRPAFNPDSAVIGVNRVEGISYAMVAPMAQPGGTIFAGLGGVARLHGDFDAFLAPSETLFLDLGSDTSALAGQSRAAQYMLLQQAAGEARPDKSLREGDFKLLTPQGRRVMARALGGRIAFHVDRAADIHQILAFCRQHGCRPVILGGAEAWRVAGELAAAKATVVLNPLLNLPADFDQLAASLENATRLHAAGVRIVFTGGDDATHNSRKVRQAAGNAVAHGLPWEAALAALTRNPAEAFGLGESQGRIAPGYQADLVLWSGDPFELSTVADQVWIGGRAMPTRSRQTDLRDRYFPQRRK